MKGGSRLAGGLALLLTLGLLGVFLVLPVGLILMRAFYGPVNGGGSQFTLAYFGLLLENDQLKSALTHSLGIAIATTVIGTLIALPLALINHRFIFPGKQLFSSLLLTPLILPPFVGAVAVQRFFARHGAVNLFLIEHGIIDQPIDWLSDQRQFIAVVILEVLHLYPILYLNLVAALANIDPSLEEMARSLGASTWRRLRDIAWPLARPGYFAGAVVVFIWALTDLGTPLLIGYQDSLPVRIFNLVSDINENPLGYALVCATIVLTTTVFLGGRKLASKQPAMMLTRGSVTNPTRRLKGWKALACQAMVGGTIAVALIPHFMVVITSLAERWFMTVLPEKYGFSAYIDVFSTSLPMTGIQNSLILAGFATVVDLGLGSFISYAVVRKLVPLGSWLDALVMVPLTLPGIVLAFGYIATFSGTPLDPMLQPMLLLVAAYSIRRLPYVVRSTTAGLQQLSPALEEAAMLFGASRFKTLRTITLPLIAANMIGGGLLCFAYAMLDVSDSLILAMQERFYPVTKAIYALSLEQGRGEIIASALGIVAVGILSLCMVGASVLMGRKLGELFRSG